ncbi:MAG TPA: TfoX/Sxy family protein [Phenylobacterium sp.]|nr:TfoX/Sxy family protein [Phenylobacterium sp.]
MSGFSAFVEELLAGLGPITIKRMFGGAGVYAGPVIFGLIIDEVLYLKTDEALRAELQAAGSEPWVYVMPRGPRAGQPASMGYWRMPESALDDPDEAVAWARRALAVGEVAARRKAPPP